MEQKDSITLGLENIALDMIIGIRDHERELPQPVDVSVFYDIPFAQVEDELSATVDYSIVLAIVRQVAQTEPKLIETFAREIADRLLKSDPRVLRVEVIVRKPRAIVGAKGSYVRVCRNA